MTGISNYGNYFNFNYGTQARNASNDDTSPASSASMLGVAAASNPSSFGIGRTITYNAEAPRVTSNGTHGSSGASGASGVSSGSGANSGSGTNTIIEIKDDKYYGDSLQEWKDSWSDQLRGIEDLSTIEGKKEFKALEEEFNKEKSQVIQEMEQYQKNAQSKLNNLKRDKENYMKSLSKDENSWTQEQNSVLRDYTIDIMFWENTVRDLPNEIQSLRNLTLMSFR